MDLVSQLVLRLHLSGRFKLFPQPSWRAAQSLITTLSRGIDINLARQLDRSSINSGKSSSVATRGGASFLSVEGLQFLFSCESLWNNCCQTPFKSSEEPWKKTASAAAASCSSKVLALFKWDIIAGNVLYLQRLPSSYGEGFETQAWFRRRQTYGEWIFSQ